jgi:hypothetical protein
MKAVQVLRPKEPLNLALTAAGSGLLLVVYAGAQWWWAWSPKRGFGLAFGLLGAALFVFEMLYPARRPKARPLFTAKAWIQAHVYLGAVAFVCVLAHAGFRLPHGGFGWWLFLLAFWTTASGLFGVYLQKWIPAKLAESLQVEALYERIPAIVEKLVAEADAAMAEASDALDRFYRQEVRPSMARLSPSWSYVFDLRAGRARALEPFRRLSGYVGDDEKDKVQELTSLYTEKLELDAQRSVQRVLRTWLWLHVPPAGLLMALLVVHVLTWLWY